MVLTQKQIGRPVNRIEGPDMNPHNYAHHIFDIGTKNIQWIIVCSSNFAGKGGYLPEEK
jgi:hypothetical protein